MNKTPYAPYGVQMATVMAQGTAIGAHGAGGFLHAVIRLPITLLGILMTWQERASERHHLRHTEDRLLKDMGLSRADVERVASIPFWRAS